MKYPYFVQTGLFWVLQTQMYRDASKTAKQYGFKECLTRNSRYEKELLRFHGSQCLTSDVLSRLLSFFCPESNGTILYVSSAFHAFRLPFN